MYKINEILIYGNPKVKDRGNSFKWRDAILIFHCEQKKWNL